MNRNREEREAIDVSIEAAVSEELLLPDLRLSLDLCDRLSNDKEERRLGIEALRLCLIGSNGQKILNAINLLDTFVKNCNIRFHYEVTNKTFIETLLSLLKRKRKKLSILDKIFINNKIWDQIENKTLYLIQLWADTFMMHEDEFPHVMQTYRLLRKEGVEFPPRDVNQRFMIKFKGQESPIFSHLEEINRAKGMSSITSVRSNAVNANTKNNYMDKFINDYDFSNELDSQITANGYPADYDMEVFTKFAIDPTEHEIIQSSIKIFDDVIDNARDIDDLKGEVAQEIIDNLKEVYQRIKMVYNYGSFASSENREVCEKITKLINQKYQKYVKKSEELKNNLTIKNSNSPGVSLGAVIDSTPNPKPIKKLKPPSTFKVSDGGSGNIDLLAGEENFVFSPSKEENKLQTASLSNPTFAVEIGNAEETMAIGRSNNEEEEKVMSRGNLIESGPPENIVLDSKKKEIKKLKPPGTSQSDHQAINIPLAHNTEKPSLNQINLLD